MAQDDGAAAPQPQPQPQLLAPPKTRAQFRALVASAIPTLEAAREDLTDVVEHLHALANRTTWAEIQAKFDELRRGPDDPHAARLASMRLVLLALLVNLPPKRNLGSVAILREAPAEGFASDYVLLRPADGGPSRLVTHARPWGRAEERLSERTVSVIEASLAKHPRGHLFATNVNPPTEHMRPYSESGYDSFVKAAFADLFGRATSVRLLRQTYLSERVDPRTVASRAAMERLARGMGSSYGNLANLVGERKLRRALRLLHDGQARRRSSKQSDHK